MMLFKVSWVGAALHIGIWLITMSRFDLTCAISPSKSNLRNDTAFYPIIANSNGTTERKLFSPSADTLHQWITGEKSNKFGLSSSTTLNPVHAQWLMLHAGYGRADFASHRISWVKTLLATVYALLAVIGVVSNLTVAYILLIRRRRALANITNVFVLVLAISDVTLCGFNMPLQAYYELQETANLNSMACKIVFTLFGIPMHISCLTILMIACDRYQIIIYPLYPRMSTRFALCLIAVICMLSTLNSLPIALYNTVSQAVIPPHSTIPYLSNHTYRFSQAHTYCVEIWPSETGRLIYSILTFLLHFLIPLCLTMGLYGHIFFRLHESRFRRSSVERKRRTNKILVRIVVCFAVCWTPWCCFCLWLEVHAYLWQTGAINAQLESLGGIHRQTDQTDTSTGGELTNSVHSAVSAEMGHFEWINLIVSHRARTYLDKQANYTQLSTMNQTNPTSTSTLDTSSMATLTSNVPLVNPDIFSMLHFENNEEKIKMIDLILKLFAMGSGCINPWLYGWLNKFAITFSKLYWTKLTRALRLGKKFREWNARRRQNKRLSHSYGTTLADNMEAPHVADATPNGHVGKRKPDPVIHICYCCGTFCKCNFVFSRSILFHGNKQDHLSFLSSAGMNGSSQRGSHRDHSHRDSQRNAESCERCAATAGRSGTGSRTSQSGSGRQKGSKCSADNLSPNAVAQLAEFEACLENVQQDMLSPFNRKEKECHQCSSYKRFGRRYSSRLSASSVGTLSYLDPSTKQTSLLPSSGYTPTPRGSFLRPGDPASTARLEPSNMLLNYGTNLNAKGEGTTFLAPPILMPATRGRSIDSGMFNPDGMFSPACGIQIASEQSQISHACPESETESDNPVVTLLCPPKLPTPDVYQVRSELLTLHEQSDSTSFEQGLNQSSGPSNPQEVVVINVHACDQQSTDTSKEATLLSVNAGFSPNPTQTVVNPWSDIWVGPGVIHDAQPYGAFCANNAAEIPFADEDSEDACLSRYAPNSPLKSKPEDKSQVIYNPYVNVDKDEPVSIQIQPTCKMEDKCVLQSSMHLPPPVKITNNEQDASPLVGELASPTLPTTQRPIKRRLSFYPGFMLRRRDGHRDSERQLDGGSRLGQAIRRLSHREHSDNHGKLKRSKVVAPSKPNETVAEDSVLGGMLALGFDESSDVDDFTHIGRMVALEAIRKQQARNRAMSVGSMPPMSHPPKKSRQSFTQVLNDAGTVHRGSRVKERQPSLINR